ncbi:MAG: hypothetical protein ABFC80_06310 [Coriobacteriales bacterium]
MYDADGLALEPPREMDTAQADVSIVEIVDPESLAVTVSDRL